MTRVRVACITMAGQEYVLFPRLEGPSFPSGDLEDGEAPAAGVRRILQAWTGSDAPPKLELVDLLAEPSTLTLLFRAMLTEPPTTPSIRAPRMGLPERVGMRSGKALEEALKTSLAYKLTRG